MQMENIMVLLGPIAYNQGENEVQKREVSICRQHITATYEIKEGTYMGFDLKIEFNKNILKLFSQVFRQKFWKIQKGIDRGS